MAVHKRKISFVYSIDNDLYWKDGLWAAIALFKENDYDVEYINVDHSEYKPTGDIVLAWGGFASPAGQATKDEKKPKAICYAGGPVGPEIHNYNVVFVEEDSLVKPFRDLGCDPVVAFGTNTKLFRPMKLTKRWDYIYPAAFAGWKRHDLFVNYVLDHNKTGLAVGYMQPDRVEASAYESLYGKVDVLPRVTPDVMVYLYNMSHNVLLTAELMGGCQRAIYEAMACGVPIVREMLNPRLLEVLDGGLKDELSYYRSLKQGLDKLW